MGKIFTTLKVKYFYLSKRVTYNNWMSENIIYFRSMKYEYYKKKIVFVIQKAMNTDYLIIEDKLHSILSQV